MAGGPICQGRRICALRWAAEGAAGTISQRYRDSQFYFPGGLVPRGNHGRVGGRWAKARPAPGGCGTLLTNRIREGSLGSAKAIGPLGQAQSLLA